VTYSNFKKRMEDDGVDQYFVNLGWVINKQITELGLQSIMLAGQIDETFPEHNLANPKMSRKQNDIFYQFREIVRMLVYVTESNLVDKRNVREAKPLVEKILELLNQKYGSYDIRNLTTLTREYYRMLIKYDLIPVAGYWEKSGLSSMRQG